MLNLEPRLFLTGVAFFALVQFLSLFMRQFGSCHSPSDYGKTLLHMDGPILAGLIFYGLVAAAAVGTLMGAR